MPTINGNEVTFRERFPAKDNWDLPKKLAQLSADASNMDLQKAVPILQKMIASWEFDGDPTKESGYDDLCIFREITPMIKACADFVQEMITGPGEAESARTSP